MRLLSSSLPMRTLLIPCQEPRPLPEPLAAAAAANALHYAVDQVEQAAVRRAAAVEACDVSGWLNAIGGSAENRTT